uniref:Uncharacterized protein n=1 Tax=Aegilops tauschii TaxID=37682 RepID=M8CDI9_AEGTA
MAPPRAVRLLHHQLQEDEDDADEMLRVARRRLSSSLSWRPVATVGARGPLAGAGGPGRDDDDGPAGC